MSICEGGKLVLGAQAGRSAVPTLLHATANPHEWLAWLRGADVPDLHGARSAV